MNNDGILSTIAQLDKRNLLLGTLCTLLFLALVHQGFVVLQNHEEKARTLHMA